MELDFIKEDDTLKIYIDKNLHLLLSLDSVLHLHSFKDTNEILLTYKINIHQKGCNDITLVYNKKELWGKILSILDNNI